MACQRREGCKAAFYRCSSLIYNFMDTSQPLGLKSNWERDER